MFCNCVPHCVKQTSRVSCQPIIQGLIPGLIPGDTVQRPPEDTGGGLAAQLKFFLVPLVAISFPNRIDVWGRLCTHFEAAKVITFASVT